jgi:hypothetical protein
MKNLAVCGCSWSSRDRNQPGIEFGQLIADHYNFNYTNLAVVSASNFVIRLQLDYAIKHLQPDLIILNWTTPARIEWNYTGKKYNPINGIKDISYITSLESPDNKFHPAGPDIDPALAFSTFQSILNEDLSANFEDVIETYPGLEKTLTKDTWKNFKNYYCNLYDTELEFHKQIYLVQSAVKELQDNNISFLMSPNTLNFFHNLQVFEKDSRPLKNEYDDLFNFIPQQNYIQGVAGMLAEVDNELYGDYENNPGRFLSSHISPDAHKVYFEKYLIPSIEKLLN